MAKEIILFTAKNLIEESGRLDALCSSCHSKMFNGDDIEKLKSIEANDLADIVEPPEFKWLLKGIMVNGVRRYRDVCWDCFFRNLRERASDGKHLIPSNTKLNSWWMHVIRGEEAYPSGKASAVGRYWADLMFTTLSKEELHSLCHRFDTASKSSFIRRYGEEEGTRRYEEYVKFHSDKNKFEYKRDKFGWSREQYDEFNKSRSVTLELCIKKHGEELGRKIFAEYCSKQAYAGCKLEYFVEKYGEEIGTITYQELNKKKSLNKETFVRKYGKVKGELIWKAYWHKRSHNSPISKISQKLFNVILSNIPTNQYDKVKYASFGGEQCIVGKSGYMFPDFLYDNKKIIEFNGDYWHRNPLIYTESAESKAIWTRDAERKAELERLGYEVLVVWEKDFRDNEEIVIQRCLNFLEIHHN